MNDRQTEQITNEETYRRISAVVAGGVSSTMRAVAIPRPLVVRRAEGCQLWDVEGNMLIDLNMGYGPHLFGYADHEVLDDVAEQFRNGHMTGFPHELDYRAGELITELMPSIEQVRFANSGTEAITSAIRLARATTERPLLLTFEGHYHGWSETVLRAGKLGSEPARQGDGPPAPGALGMIPEALNSTLQIPWNDPDALEEVFASHGDRIAAVIAEPVMGNSGVVLPLPGYLGQLREITKRHGSILIFDEVITGFRVALGGAQQRYEVTPDLTILSKVLGGGIPVAAFGGSREVMALLAENKALHAGVYAGNHASVRAVVSTLEKIRRRPQVYADLEALGEYAQGQIHEAFAAEDRHVLVQRAGSLMSVALLTRPVDPSAPLREVRAAIDFDGHRQLQMAAQTLGLYFHPNPLEPWFLSTAHTHDDLAKVVATLRLALSGLRR
ncbi:aspartate aminotransferase family protein [Streptomyces niveiscabiei]|uniref:Aspartate aminotransferase family protein n=1 Tax=Streptomyces niveiscabiei TaxID=164115 RepID=A0ABW9I853_9ACTN